MATPDLVNVATINGKTIAGAVTTSNADIIDAAADKLLKVNCMYQMLMERMTLRFLFQ